MRILFFIVLLDIAGFAVLLPPIMYVLTNWGASPAFATFIIATYSIGKFLIAPIWGALSDRYGRKPIMAIALMGDLVSYLILIFANSPELVLVSRVVAGLSAGNIATYNASISDMTTHENRAKGLGVIGAGMGLGYVIGPAIGGVLGGMSAETANLSTPALASLLLSLASLLLILIFFKEPKATKKPVNMSTPSVGRIKMISMFAKRDVFGFLFICVFLVSITSALIGPVTPLLVELRYGWGPRQMGMVFVAVGLAIAIVQGGLVGRAVDLLGEVKLVKLASLIVIFGLLMIVYTPISAGLVIGYCLVGAGATLFTTAINALASKLTGKNEQGLVMGAMQSMHSLGRASGPVFAGSLYMIWIGLPYISGVICVVICFLLMLWLSKSKINYFKPKV